MAVREGDRDPVGSEVLEPLDRVGGKRRLCLFPVGDDWRAGRLEASNGVANRLLVARAQLLAGNFTGGELRYRRDEVRRSRNASDRVSGNRHAPQAIRREAGGAIPGTVPNA